MQFLLVYVVLKGGGVRKCERILLYMCILRPEVDVLFSVRLGQALSRTTLLLYRKAL